MCSPLIGRLCGSHAGGAVGYEEEVYRLEADVDILAVQVRTSDHCSNLCLFCYMMDT